jgi:hypothetical protein
MKDIQRSQRAEFLFEQAIATRNSKKYYTSERNNFSNNLTSTLNGSTPGEGSATQCRTPYTDCQTTKNGEAADINTSSI